MLSFLFSGALKSAGFGTKLTSFTNLLVEEINSLEISRSILSCSIFLAGQFAYCFRKCYVSHVKTAGPLKELIIFYLVAVVLLCILVLFFCKVVLVTIYGLILYFLPPLVLMTVVIGL